MKTFNGSNICGDWLEINKVIDDRKCKILEWFGLEGSFKDNPVQQTAIGRDISHPRLDCAKPHPIWPWTMTSGDKEHSQLLWTACSSVSPPSM